MLGIFSIEVRASIAIIMFAGCGYESLANNQDMLLSRVRQLTFEGRRSGEGYYSADGSKLIFQSEREAGNPFYHIYTIDFKTGRTFRVSPGDGKTTCAFFHPGVQALFL